MAYNQELADRISTEFSGRDDIVTKKMFGGVGFLLNGNMCVGVNKDNLVVRIAPEQTDAALAKPHARLFDITGRPMKGWIIVEPAGTADDRALRDWMALAQDFVSTLPPK